MVIAHWRDAGGNANVWRAKPDKGRKLRGRVYKGVGNVRFVFVIIEI